MITHLELKETPKGKGVFTTVSIPKETCIYEFKGPISNKDGINKLNPCYLQIGKDLFINASGSLDDRFKHSCNPNSYVYIVGKRAFLYSLYPIAQDTEITFDYSTTDLLDDWHMDCKCNDFNCRKIIAHYNSLPEELKKRYKELNILPYYITGKIA